MSPGCSCTRGLANELLAPATKKLEPNFAAVMPPSCASAPSSTSTACMPSARVPPLSVSTSSEQPASLHTKPPDCPSKRARLLTDGSMLRSKRRVTLRGGPLSSQSKTWPCAGETDTSAGGSRFSGPAARTKAARGGSSSVTRPPAPAVISRAAPLATMSRSTVPWAQCVVKATLLLSALWKLATTATRSLCEQPRRKMRTSALASGGVCTASHSSRPKEPR
mmetsp:Transcript_76520/g.224603  ORF Transcript_76520/g.224603 Transcript_76520/m.224603 type:complete len:222 (+) Transcript_76520:139-804(+)